MAAVAVPALTNAQSPAPVAFTEQTLNFTERDANDFAFIDHAPKTKFGKQGPQKLSNGDQLVFRSYVVDSARSASARSMPRAWSPAPATGASIRSTGLVTTTFTVPGGQMFVAVGGKPFASSTTRGAVTGGTGIYEGATGTFTSVGESNAKDTFHIWIPSK